MEFIRPDGHHVDQKYNYYDSVCDSNKMTIAILDTGVDYDEDFLDRVTRFVRLWRKTKLSLRELNNILKCPKIGDSSLDDNFIIKFHKFETLRNSMKLSVDDMLLFFQDFDINDPKGRYQLLFSKKYISPE
ncbi:MAG: hypothetical protein IPK03_03255 [Bacteroidetes bacterium]|nr:hypothetical protein [Bacteroidota bacterium]